jgi:hypothetical protein
MNSARPFRAFVSYCHADAAFAARLQRRLEAYRLPRRLAGQVEPLPGQGQGKIGPVFRDRADLSAATDLSAAVREAIAASSALVVVASPDAERSHWVAREIALFRELHPEAAILVALARGEPAEALPDVLRNGAEPLCADFRKQGDGERLAFLKIVAGLADLPLDTLVQRDAQRQLRRVMGVTLGAVILVVIMALLLVMALRAREQAERRRTDAEGLVKFMLTTLRDRMKQTGDLNLMHSVNERALAYFDDQGPEVRLPDDSRQLRALILHALGEDEAAKGNEGTASAVKRFRVAYRTTQQILSHNPDNPDAIFAHAQSEYWLGYYYWQKVEIARVRTHWGAYLDLAGRLTSVEPGTRRSLMELGYAHGNMCELNMFNRADVRAGLVYCRAALRYERAALALVPGATDENSKIQLALGNRMGWLADALIVDGQLDEAERLRKGEAAIYETIREREPASVKIRDQLAWPRIGLAKIDIARGKVAQGIERLETCLRDLDRLSEALPDNEIVVGERARVNILIAKAKRDARRGDWRASRDRAESLLSVPVGRALPEGLQRYRRMLDKLNEGGM